MNEKTLRAFIRAIKVFERAACRLVDAQMSVYRANPGTVQHRKRVEAMDQASKAFYEAQAALQAWYLEVG